MKINKIITAISVASTLSLNAFAQKLNQTQVPAPVKNSFAKAYPNVKNVKWEKEKGDYEAGFKQGSNEMSAVFASDGSQKESELEIKISTLPAAVKAYVKQHYKGATIKEAAKITRAGGEVHYEAEIKGQDLLFDSEGKFIKVAKD